MKVHFLYLHPVQQLADMNAVNCQQGGCCLVSPYITSTENTVWVKDYHTHSNFQYSLETVHGISVGERERTTNTQHHSWCIAPAQTVSTCLSILWVPDIWPYWKCSTWCVKNNSFQMWKELIPGARGSEIANGRLDWTAPLESSQFTLRATRADLSSYAEWSLVLSHRPCLPTHRILAP